MAGSHQFNDKLPRYQSVAGLLWTSFYTSQRLVIAVRLRLPPLSLCYSVSMTILNNWLPRVPKFVLTLHQNRHNLLLQISGESSSVNSLTLLLYLIIYVMNYTQVSILCFVHYCIMGTHGLRQARGHPVICISMREKAALGKNTVSLTENVEHAIRTSLGWPKILRKTQLDMPLLSSPTNQVCSSVKFQQPTPVLIRMIHSHFYEYRI